MELLVQWLLFICGEEVPLETDVPLDGPPGRDKP